MTNTDTPRPTYQQLWKRVPGALGYLLPNIVIATIISVVLWLMLGLGLGFAVLYGGIFIGIAMFAVARWSGSMDLSRLEAAGMEPIERPTWPTIQSKTPHGRLWAMMSNAHYWSYFFHGALVQMLLMAVTWGLSLMLVLLAILGPTSVIWTRFQGDDNESVGDLLYTYVPSLGITDPALFDFWLYTGLGVLVLATLPWTLRGLMNLHHGAARLMLARTRADDLADEVENLAASRSSAVAAENTGLRRLERDIHDGPQQRLIRLQMDLAATERMLDKDPGAAKDLLVEARAQATDTLEELRALSRGFAPPLLQDRGLMVALDSLVARNTIPTTVIKGDVPRLSPETELGAYFVVAELLSNTAKHSSASAVTVAIGIDRSGDTERCVISVTDNGTGGANILTGHGLAGLGERVNGLRGTMQIDSPAGGPTVVTVALPLEV
ncbi:sensor histidine kinase [Lysinibacter cavernae]|uniref:histidine kinase n=1 Tax=Lysinibacter cavernae TaxID=1640652 RepID=A0A7X5R058_9MICO|nr:sensor domain-containing protein [Lysinibacter cavernae]NIH53191.1 signal transduction histidine kinase [Lysinibacter cavernae]